MSQFAGGDLSFAELFEKSCKNSMEDRVVKGTVVNVDENYVTVDVGLKSEGRVATSEFSSFGKKVELKAGDIVDVYIDRYEDKSGEIVLSREKAIREAAWDGLEVSFKKGESVVGAIFNRVKGGFMVDLGGITAFLPGSQVDVRPIKDISPLMGIEQPFLILKVDKTRENIVVSRRGILEGANAEECAKVLENLEEGSVIKGVVKNVTNYGAFVDVGGIDGLLHNTDISWKRVNHPSEILLPGQEVTVKVIKINKETRRISLGMKQLETDPWSGIDLEFPVGSRIKGRVTNVTDYGIFVEVKEGVEGLVYVSEVSWKKVPPSKVASPGEALEVVVLDVDIAKRRMGLGIKQLHSSPWERIVVDFPVGHVFETTISKVAEFGIFVKVSDEIDGMVHVHDMSWEKSPSEELLSKYKKGDSVNVKVLEVDVDKERVSLGVKQLLDNPYAGVSVDMKKGTIVTCVVSVIQEDGLEVTLASGAHGFIKKQDLSKDRQDRRSDRFAIGEKVDAKIISVDKTGRKIGLSIRALEIEEEKQVMAEFGSSDSGASLGDILGAAIGNNNNSNKE